ncbi:MAG TPA: hypothetical protein VHJ20_03640 [Polyangia bacterium]|nr:hypothetical protein [Polyangia bacterium]
MLPLVVWLIARAGDAYTLTPGQTTTIVVAPQPGLGAPLERAVPSATFERAVALDGERRWEEAAALYEQAGAAWSTAARVHPTPALARAVEKATRERQRSLILASTIPRRGRFESVVTSLAPLDEAQLLRDKLMVVRASTGHVPEPLYARARAAFEDALRAPGRGSEAPLYLWLCATHAAAGARDAALLARARAHLADADRHNPDLALPLAACAAALGDDDAALGWLETLVLRPAPHQIEPYRLRELYLANDWDRLRGRPLFESLFPPPPP